MSTPHAGPRIPPLLGLAIGVLAVSTASIFIRQAQNYAPSLVIAAYRLSIAALALAPFALGKGMAELRSLDRKSLGLAMLSGLFLAGHFATWITSLEYTSVASSVVLVSTTPLWVALFSPLFLKEPLSRQGLMGMLVALIGGALVGVSDLCSWQAGKVACASFDELISGTALLGDLLALAGGILAAAYLIIGRRLRAGMSLTGYIFLVYGIAALVLIGIAGMARQSFAGYPPIAYLWFFLLGIIPQLIGHSSYNWALRYLSAAYVAMAILGEPIGSTVLAYFLLNETPTLPKVIGAILIFVGIFLATRGESKVAIQERGS